MEERKQVMRKHCEERYGVLKNAMMHPPMPESLNIELNNTCNHRCVFCTYHGTGSTTIHPKPEVMQYEFAKKLIHQASRLGIGRKELGLYLSGEPFLYSRLTDLVRYAKTEGFPYVYLTTNGALATPENMKAVLDAGLDSIRFSVNAADKDMYQYIHGKDDFDQVVSNIQFMHSYIEENKLNVATSISCVITKKTQNIREKMKSMFEKYIDDIVFFPVSFAYRENDSLKAELGIVEEPSEIDYDFKCPVPFNSMYIDAGGHLLYCCESALMGGYIADLHDDFDLEKAWYGEEFCRIRSIFLEGASDKNTVCENCRIRKARLKMTD